MFRALAVALPVVGCQGADTSKAKPTAPIEVLDATKSVIARLVPGHPCRANIEGVEMLVGGPPIVAQLGADRFTGAKAENGTTFSKNDQQVARIHAKQLFGPDGIPIIRVMDNGDIADKSNALLRKAVAGPNNVAIGDLTITGTTDIVLAAMLSAKEVLPEVRALVACNYLLEQ